MKQLLLLFLFLNIIQCSVTKRQINQNINETKKTIFGDKKIQKIHDEFIEDCKVYKIKNVTKKHLRVVDYQTLGFGYWGVTFPEASIILIDTTFMNSSEELFYVVLYHELAHFYLESRHDKNCNLCIMQPIIDEKRAKEIYKNLQFHKDWLFKKQYYNSVIFNILEN